MLRLSVLELKSIDLHWGPEGHSNKINILHPTGGMAPLTYTEDLS